ncbi:MAG: LSm family protein [Candidatus Aminicenantales bacterium]
MRKRFILGVAILVFMAGFAVVSYASPDLQRAGQKYKITLENGRVIEGEIVSVTEKTLSIRDASLGVIAIARENIIKIEPPLDEAKDAGETSPPAAPATPRYVTPPSAPQNNGIKLGFSLSGGLGMINGGDYNSYIRDWNAYCADYNDYYGGDYYSIDWKEAKSMMDFKGEILARFGKNFGIGLGVEFLRKANPGNIALDFEESTRYTYASYYIDFSDYENATWVYDQTLSVIPITLNLYYYIPLARLGEFYVNVGPGYYMGTLKSNLDYSDRWGYYNEYHWNDGDLWPPHYKSDSQQTETDMIDATCNTIGFHFGAGFNYNISDNIALFGEAFYRLANFKNWTGTAGYDYNYQRDYGWWTGSAWSTHYISTSSSDDTWQGDLWYYEFHNSTFDADYSELGLYEDRPDSSSGSNIRKGEININGFAFRVGIKFFFGLGGGR